MTTSSRSHLIIRPATPADAETIHAGLLGIGEAVGLVDKIKSTPNDMRRYGFGDRPHFHTLIAEIDSEFAGMSLYFMIFSTWRGRPGGYVQDLFVAEKFRGRSIADALMRHTAQAVKAAGGTFVSLAVDRKNLRAQAFYGKLGMQTDDSDFIMAAEGEAFDRLAEGGNT